MGTPLMDTFDCPPGAQEAPALGTTKNISKCANIFSRLWSITYYNERVREEVLAMPAGIVADYECLARQRLKDVQHG